ncbi:uncharacterized protein N0V89_004274 [Didymosphaeria variabile]|uniref:Uncharacterized protein n=1 Tax=Didymosphaeria variabile TaxID=1932322 RepID=A0A9W9CC97_9PLEO|nr:uncharacterized protein N0V89_004274 [Didymosphaeria variabile]KAJ4356244.1 hypothetical protein N0V89_004274 [Didymosphaeria variabile]
MPVQRTMFGQPLALRLPPRRFQLLFVFLLLFIATIYAFGAPSPASIPTYEQVKGAVKDPHLPDLSDIKDHIPKIPTQLPDLPKLDVFSPPAHTPPEQANSTASSSYGAIKWLTDFKWRNPFSNKITLDENRAVLPPLANRPPIYTYYEPKPKQDKKVTEAENRLILAWRRAWWAQGFQPTVLSHKDAMGPQFEMVQRMKLESSVELDIFRWLAWGNMGGGILADWLTLPMAQYDNSMISFLRRAEYPKLSRVESLQNGIFFGESTLVKDAINEAINNKILQDVPANKDNIAKLALQDGGIVVNLLSADIAIDKKANGLAYYNMDVVKLTNTTQVQGLDLLADLINSHLHLTFQETHPDGIAIVKPLPEHTTALTYNAIEIGRNLTQCPSSPMPKSCPPNRQKCKPCDPNKPFPFKLVPTFMNATKQYSIGTVPHPYTLTTLHYMREDIDANFLRKETGRNPWLTALTKELLGPDHSELYRVLFFKEEVAALRKASHSLWLTAERTTQADLEWIFGFNLPQSASFKEPNSPSKDSELIIFPRPGEPKAIEGVQIQEERWIRNEEHRLKKAREALSKSRKAKEEDPVHLKVKEVEDWNLADTEAWRFARAFSARRRNERKDWEEKEKNYSGSERKAGVKSRGGGRWSDRFR